MIIHESNSLYEYMVKLLLTDSTRLDDETLLQRIAELAELAFNSGPTLVADHRLEELLFAVASRIDPKPDFVSPKLQNMPSRIVHITTGIFDMGGHTRIILNWIQADPTRSHTLVTTGKNGSLSEWMLKILKKAGCSLILLDPDETRIERASKLRALIMDGGFDLVISHHFHFDTVTIAALSVVGLPQVFVFNQGDHVYWLGTGMADAVLDFRRSGQAVSLRNRGIRQSLYLPYILEPQAEEPSKDLARKIAKLTEWRVVLTSMARIQKFEPCKDYNFHRTFAPLMARHPDAVLLLIGVNLEEYRKLFHADPPENIKPLGNIAQPATILRCSDIWIEPIPWGSALATFDGCRYGAVPVFAYGLAPCIYGCAVRDLFEDSGVDLRLNTESEYREHLTLLMSDAGLMSDLSNKVQRYCNDRFVSPRWNKYLDQAYTAAIGGQHRVEVCDKIVYDESLEFRYYMQCKSEDMASHLTMCMNRLGSVGRPLDLLSLSVSYLWHRLRSPSLLGIKSFNRFVLSSVARIIGLRWLGC
jgi:hypothetical protein